MKSERQVPLAVTTLPSVEERWASLRHRVATCQACELRATCRQTVLGEGAPGARIMLVGEGPGAKEDEQGRPFVGAAGQLLDSILAAVGYVRHQVYITNVVKCRPPGNRLPKPAEVAACLPYLHQQLDLVDPAIVVCLGALATRTLLDAHASISRVRGKSYRVGDRHLLPTFHPAALLRDPQKKRPVWEDMQLLRRLAEEL